MGSANGAVSGGDIQIRGRGESVVEAHVLMRDRSVFDCNDGCVGSSLWLGWCRWVRYVFATFV